MDDKLVIGTRVKVLREKMKPRLSQRRLAARAGVSHSTVYRLERGETMPEVETLVSIAQALETSFDKLTGLGSEPTQTETPEEREILDNAMRASAGALDRASVLAGIRQVLAKRSRTRQTPSAPEVVASSEPPASQRRAGRHQREA